MPTIPIPSTTVEKRYRSPSVNAARKMTGHGFLMYSQPMIYMWKRGNEYLYIGCSSIGFARVFTTTHHVIKRALVEPTDRFVFKLVTLEEMTKVEERLIRKYKPKYNRAGVCSSSR